MVRKWITVIIIIIISYTCVLHSEGKKEYLAVQGFCSFFQNITREKCSKMAWMDEWM